MKNNIKKIIRIWITIWLLILGISYYIIINYILVPQVCSGENCFIVELARTPAEQQQGLMNRESMDEGSGMLFIFQWSEFHNFRMKDTLIPLDMIWIDKQFKVVRIMTAQPCIADQCPIYQPGIAAKYVLEINAEMAEKHGIQEWTKMKFVNIQ